MSTSWPSPLALLAQYKFEGRNEAAIREEWIQPLLRLLGYGPGTLNQIEYGESLRLADPFRMVGSKRVELDYRPTVLGRGLWILEAKAPVTAPDWREHLQQAWFYATHPAVNVPFFVVADGTRIVVHDVTQLEWDSPVVDVRMGELDVRFDELAGVLGARNVAGTIRRRVLEYLRRGLAAELDFGVLDAVVAEVAAIAREAREDVAENRRVVLADQAERNEAVRRVVAQAGMWGIAQDVNEPLWISRDIIDRAVAAVLNRPPEQRATELGQCLAATRGAALHGTLAQRAFWPVRSLAFATALRIRTEPGCAEAAQVILESVAAEAFYNFPNDPVARAAHRVELLLPVAVSRALLSERAGDFERVLAQLDARRDAESRLRWPVYAEEMVLNLTRLQCRSMWARLEPWEAVGLDATADALERLIDVIEVRPSAESALALMPFETDRTWDPLVSSVILFCHDYAGTDVLTSDMRGRSVPYRDAPGRTATAARALLGTADS